MTVLETGDFFEPQVGWLGAGILLCDGCGKRVETWMDVITEAIVFGEWSSYRLRNEDGDAAVVHHCPACSRELPSWGARTVTDG
jgi:hypothetical protein